MRNIKLLISYDGTDFRGWQQQPGYRTVQAELEKAIAQLTGKATDAHVSGRTDAGVHALGQVVQFYTASHHAPAVFVKALNALLPLDVRVLEATDMPQAFHPSIDAKSKRYRYTIDNGRIASPFHTRYAWHIFHPLDLEAMRAAGRSLVGRHDFHSFETNWPNRMSSVRTIFDLTIERVGDLVLIEVEADGFLYNMVRSIAGTLMFVGTGKRPSEWVAEVLLAEDRSEAGPTAPPQGLCMLYVRYESTRENAR